MSSISSGIFRWFLSVNFKSLLFADSFTLMDDISSYELLIDEDILRNKKKWRRWKEITIFLLFYFDPNSDQSEKLRTHSVGSFARGGERNENKHKLRLRGEKVVRVSNMCRSGHVKLITCGLFTSFPSSTCSDYWSLSFFAEADWDEERKSRWAGKFDLRHSIDFTPKYDLRKYWI